MCADDLLILGTGLIFDVQGVFLKPRMDNTLLVILTALCSGLIATVITLWWQSRTHNKQERMAIFKTLMSKRYDLADEACVEALKTIIESMKA